jgi:hypothetical protein
MPTGNRQNQAPSTSTETAAEHTETDGRWERGSDDGDLAEDEEDDEDADAEAEEIARRLNDQLWAEISKAQAEVAAAATSGVPISSSTPAQTATLSCGGSTPDRRVQEALRTIRIILKDVGNDPLAHSTLSTTLIPGMVGVSILDAFNGAVSANAIPKEVAKPLSHLLVSLARSDTLFSSLRHSEESSIQLERGKRQRDEQDGIPDGAPPPKRHFPPPVPAVHPPPMPYALHTQLDAASRAIMSALTGPAAPPTGPPPPPLIASIQFPLHQVFLFAMTAAGPARNALQELGGLIQALGVLSGIPIGGGPGPTAWGHPGTSVHPCSFPACGKTFARLYSLRAHTRVHAAERPFRCTRCPAAFARNHDLKRHARLHEDRAWQCTGCAKAFSRRDALTRHRHAAVARHSACATADVAQIDVPPRTAAAGAEDEMRRTRMWHGASASDAVAAGALGIPEEGELPRPVLVAAHEAVARLHPVLHACVARALGSCVVAAAPLEGGGDAPAVDAAGSSQATLARALARAQAQIAPDAALGLAGSPGLSSPAPAAGAEAGSDGVPLAHAAAAALGPSLYGLSPEQTHMLERAITSAASAAQLQAEAEAALEEEEEEEEGSGEGEGEEGQ